MGLLIGFLYSAPLGPSSLLAIERLRSNPRSAIAHLILLSFLQSLLLYAFLQISVKTFTAENEIYFRVSGLVFLLGFNWLYQKKYKKVLSSYGPIGVLLLNPGTWLAFFVLASFLKDTTSAALMALSFFSGSLLFFIPLSVVLYHYPFFTAQIQKHAIKGWILLALVSIGKTWI